MLSRRQLRLPTLEEIAAERVRRLRERAPKGFEDPPAWFHEHQLKAWASEAPVLAICAGWQSGKTVFLPQWLKREIQRRGPGDYGAFSSTFKLLERKFLPELRSVFEPYAAFKSGAQRFVFTELGSLQFWARDWDGSGTTIQLGHAESSDSLESATMKAVAWDEAGQRLIPEQSFLTVQSRLMVARGRMALASRPYEAGWYERLVRSGLLSPGGGVEVVSFPSWANPENPSAEDGYWDELRALLPPWKFAILYEGRFERPLGLIYDCFDFDRDTCEDFAVPGHWNVYPGADFGPVNAAGVLVAEDPGSGELFVVRQYHSGVKRTTAEHVRGIKGPYSTSVGAAGSHGEEGCREAARAAGLLVDEPPFGGVEVQIQCVYEQLAGRKLKVFRRECSGVVEALQLFSREVSADGVVLDKIAGHEPHVLAALRYVITKLRPPRGRRFGGSGRVVRPDSGSGEFL
jgi:hypothetical protein